MRIAVNARFLIEGKMEGIGWFSFETIQGLVKKYPEHTFILYFDRPYSKQFKFGENVECKVLYPPARHPVLWFAFFHISLGIRMWWDKIDVLYSPDSYLCPWSKVPTALVVHDLAYIHFPESVPALVKRYYTKWFPKYIHKAKQVYAVSEATKQDIIAQYGVHAERIQVICNGVSAEFQDFSMINRDSLPKNMPEGPYFTYIGALQPRKNIIRLMEAFDAFKRHTGHLHKLVIGGAHSWIQSEIEATQARLQFGTDIQFVGRVNRVELQALLKYSEALVYVSLFEGFGIPLIEAMHAETAVITSNTSSMVEVAGEAALLVDPLSIEEIALAMQRVIEAPNLRATLIEAGKIQRSVYSWEKAVELIDLENCKER